MKRYVVFIAIVTAVLIAAFNAFGQDEEKAGQTERRQDMRDRFRNMSPEERAYIQETAERNKWKTPPVNTKNLAKAKKQAAKKKKT